MKIGAWQGMRWFSTWLLFFVVAGLVQGWLMRPSLTGSEDARRAYQAEVLAIRAELMTLRESVQNLQQQQTGQTDAWSLLATEQRTLRQRLDQALITQGSEDRWRAWVYEQLQERRTATTAPTTP